MSAFAIGFCFDNNLTLLHALYGGRDRGIKFCTITLTNGGREMTEIGHYIMEGHAMSNKKLLTEIKKQRHKFEQYENKYGILGNPHEDRLLDLKAVARGRGRK